MTAYLVVKDAVSALDFYQKAFGASLDMKLVGQEGEIIHSELSIGNAYFGVSEQSDSWGNKSPDMLEGSPILLSLEVEDVDSFIALAVEHGCEITEAIENQFYGSRSGRIKDPYGFHWMIMSTHTVMTQEETQAAMEEWMSAQSE